MTPEAIPSFANEEEEANWWDAHPDAITSRFQEALKNGTIKRLSQTNLPGASHMVTLRIPTEELSRAQKLAAKRGVRYETYLNMLLHQALEEEEKKLAS